MIVPENQEICYQGHVYKSGDELPGHVAQILESAQEKPETAKRSRATTPEAAE